MYCFRWLKLGWFYLYSRDFSFVFCLFLRDVRYYWRQRWGKCLLRGVGIAAMRNNEPFDIHRQRVYMFDNLNRRYFTCPYFGSEEGVRTIARILFFSAIPRFQLSILMTAIIFGIQRRQKKYLWRLFGSWDHVRSKWPTPSSYNLHIRYFSSRLFFMFRFLFYMINHIYLFCRFIW